MEIISHRGFWKKKSERNEKSAFVRSFSLGFGTETDLRDHLGEVVVAHDMPIGEPMTFSELLRIMGGRNLTLALNIKADGLGARIKELLIEHKHTNYFTFDMSVPELVRQLKGEMIVFTGLSDIQPFPVFLDKCQGIWLDCFNSDWYDEKIVDKLLEQGKRVCVVSSDLHLRSTEKQWDILCRVKNILSPNLLLCTDKPLIARDFFGVRQ